MATTQQTSDDDTDEPFNGTTSEDMSLPELWEIRGGADQLHAYAEIPGGSLLRLIGNETGSGWIEAVEIGEVGDWKRVTEGYGLAPTQKYNQLVDEISVHEVDEVEGGEER